MSKDEIIEYLYEHNVRGDLTIEQMAEDLADRKTESSSEKPNNYEDDEYWKHLFIEVVKGHMSDAEANQAWYEYINHKDEPQTDCLVKKPSISRDSHEIAKTELQTERPCDNCQEFDCYGCEYKQTEGVSDENRR